MTGPSNLDSSPSTARTSIPAYWWFIALALIAGIFIGRMMDAGSTARAADPANDATATREAELAELDDLRTKVAQPVVCTPAPSPTATATAMPEPTPTIVPAVATGQEVAYGEDWRIAIASIQPAPKPDGVEANGPLMLITVQITNLTTKPLNPPFTDWRLVDAAGNIWRINVKATAEIAGAGWGLKVAKNATEERGLVFEVGADSGDAFVLESDTEPAFRVELNIESRG